MVPASATKRTFFRILFSQCWGIGGTWPVGLHVALRDGKTQSQSANSVLQYFCTIAVAAAFDHSGRSGMDQSGVGRTSVRPEIANNREKYREKSEKGGPGRRF
jgi:hypothetical protein